MTTGELTVAGIWIESKSGGSLERERYSMLASLAYAEETTVDATFNMKKGKRCDIVLGLPL